jgi:hypothetical protein
MSEVVGSNNSHKTITNTAWILARFCKLWAIILYIPSLLLLDSIFVLAGKFHVSIIDSALRLETNATNDKDKL